MNKVQEKIERTRGIVGLIIEAAGPQEEWMPLDAKIAEIALETADTLESMQARIELLEKVVEAVKGSDGLKCPNCPDAGFWVAEGEQFQCQFCYEVTDSIFNRKALKEQT